MNEATLADLKQIQESLTKPFGPATAGNDPRLRDDEIWAPYLRRLPVTCALWRMYLDFDGIRVAFEEVDVKVKGWREQIDNVNTRLIIDDPDKADVAAHADDLARGDIYQRAIRDKAEWLAELRERARRAEERWALSWQSYAQAKNWLVTYSGQQSPVARAWGDITELLGDGASSEKRQYIHQLEHA